MSKQRSIDRNVLQYLIPQSFSIISDDCWGMACYSFFGYRYDSPFIGLVVESNCYLDFLLRFLAREPPELEFIETEREYPVALCLGAKLGFVHDESGEIAKEKFEQRYERINWNRLLVKIDFGKPGYSIEDMERWNKMELPNVLALYSSTTEIPSSGLHGGILVPEWCLNGYEMFALSVKHFQLPTWLRTGEILPSEGR
ncbi:MAG: DUF1919 domain-containing protein [Verrucomicrobiales bacterium]|nr:DUF1919 domain-containing protein [Verrucomicrobiales bacterium]